MLRASLYAGDIGLCESTAEARRRSRICPLCPHILYSVPRELVLEELHGCGTSRLSASSEHAILVPCWGAVAASTWVIDPLVPPPGSSDRLRRGGASQVPLRHCTLAEDSSNAQSPSCWAASKPVSGELPAATRGAFHMASGRLPGGGYSHILERCDERVRQATYKRAAY
jgi:hypothetical protein